MQSLYDDVVDALTDHTFSIPNVNIRKPFDESPKVYPMGVVWEIVSIPKSHGTVTGETHTALGYQIDWQAKACEDSEGTVLSAFDASRTLAEEASDYLDTTFKLTRRFCRPSNPAPDVVQHTWRGDATLDSSGYTYRK